MRNGHDFVSRPLFPHGFRRWIAVAISLTAFTSSTSLTWVVGTKTTFASGLRKTAFVKAVAAARPAVVNIEGQKTLHSTTGSRSGESRRVQGMGTGIIVDQRGYILTNYHVVDEVRRIRVTLENQQTYDARLLAFDEITDLAVIKINAPETLTTISVGTATDLMPGEPVIAVGNAYGYQHTVTRGIVSALHREVVVSDTQTYHDLIQTDAAINPGNSGGPLLNIDGELIGINVAVRAGAHNIGFAIPIDKAMVIAAELVDAQQLDNIWLGIEPDSQKGHLPLGVVVGHVDENSPASAVGLTPGDVITAIDERNISHPLDLEFALLGHKPGETLPMTLTRDDQIIQAELTLIKKPVETPESLRVWRTLGLRFRPVTASQFQQTEPNYSGGLKILKVRANSQADEQGIQPGDVLVGLHVWEMDSMEDVLFVLNSKNRTDSKNRRILSRVKYHIVRDAKTYFGYVNLDANR